jgi:hypothetical protein
LNPQCSKSSHTRNSPTHNIIGLSPVVAHIMVTKNLYSR